jgi:hypothetical protein
MYIMSSVLKTESLEAWIGRETRKLKLRDRYWANEDFRKRKMKKIKIVLVKLCFVNPVKRNTLMDLWGLTKKFAKVSLKLIL